MRVRLRYFDEDTFIMATVGMNSVFSSAQVLPPLIAGTIPLFSILLYNGLQPKAPLVIGLVFACLMAAVTLCITTLALYATGAAKEGTEESEMARGALIAQSLALASGITISVGMALMVVCGASIAVSIAIALTAVGSVLFVGSVASSVLKIEDVNPLPSTERAYETVYG